MTIIHFLTIILFIYLASTLTYLMVLAIAGRLGRTSGFTSYPDKAHIAILIPSYKDDNVIVDTAVQALKQDYPPDRYSITVIADQLLPDTVARLKALPIQTLEVSWEKSMKSKSINAAFRQIPAGKYDLALILDADNVMAPDCLEKINHAWHSGCQVIQLHRTAKNKNTSIAVLDALSEEINNTIFRRGQRALGLSSALIGSGMAFNFDFLKHTFALPNIQDNPGEDKEVEIQLLKEGMVVEFIDNAYVYDEKVQRKEVFEKQRTRWLAAQIYNIRLFWSKDLRSRFPDKNYLHKFFQALFLPRLLVLLVLLLVLLLCASDWMLKTNILWPVWKIWIALPAIYALTMLIAVPRNFYNRQTAIALLKIPLLMLAMLRALLGIKKSRSGFLHTPKEFSR